MSYRRSYATPPPAAHAGGDFVQHYCSWSEYCDAAIDGQTSMTEQERSSRVGSDWFHGGPWSQAATLSRSGWPESEALISKYSDALFGRLASLVIQPEIRYGFEGLDYDIGRLLDGEPEHWVSWCEPEEGQLKSGTRVARILCHVGGLADVTTEILQAKGAAVFALCRLLERAGIRTEVTIATCNAATGTHNPTLGAYTLHTATVKRPDQDFDLPIIGYALAHPTCYRRLMWSLWEQIPFEWRRHVGIVRGGGYGASTDIPEQYRESYDVYVSCSRGEWLDAKHAEAWVLEQLTALGVELRQDVAA
jgi:hypothetical protein